MRSFPKPDAEFYPTPAWPVRALLAAADPPLPSGGLWCEPAVGEGAIVRAVEEYLPGSRRWHCIDLRSEAVEQARQNLSDLPGVTVEQGDFPRVLLPAAISAQVNVYITNSAFSLGFDYARACVALAGRRAHVALLLRQAFAETRTRGAFLRAHPCDLYTLDVRPKFVGPRTDMWACAWFVWGPGRGGRFRPLECP